MLTLFLSAVCFHIHSLFLKIHFASWSQNSNFLWSRGKHDPVPALYSHSCTTAHSTCSYFKINQTQMLAALLPFLYRGGKPSSWNPWVKLAFKNTQAHLVSRMCCQSSEGSSKNYKVVKVLWCLSFITTENICWKNLFGSCSVGYNVNVLYGQLLLQRSHCKRKDSFNSHK